jgi:hypothetical protein
MIKRKECSEKIWIILKIGLIQLVVGILLIIYGYKVGVILVMLGLWGLCIYKKKEKGLWKIKMKS